MNTLDTVEAQARAVATFFEALAEAHPRLPAANDERGPDDHHTEVPPDAADALAALQA
jgi:hypothetical protein